MIQKIGEEVYRRLGQAMTLLRLFSKYYEEDCRVIPKIATKTITVYIHT